MVFACLEVVKNDIASVALKHQPVHVVATDVFGEVPVTFVQFWYRGVYVALEDCCKRHPQEVLRILFFSGGFVALGRLCCTQSPGGYSAGDVYVGHVELVALLADAER